MNIFIDSADVPSIKECLKTGLIDGVTTNPFVGRIDDQGYAGLEVVRSIAGLYSQHCVPTQVLAASIRTPHRAVRSFYNGAAIATMPPSVFWKMYTHILTSDGLRIFEEDAANFTKM